MRLVPQPQFLLHLVIHPIFILIFLLSAPPLHIFIGNAKSLADHIKTHPIIMQLNNLILLLSSVTSIPFAICILTSLVVLTIKTTFRMVYDLVDGLRIIGMGRQVYLLYIY